MCITVIYGNNYEFTYTNKESNVFTNKLLSNLELANGELQWLLDKIQPFLTIKTLDMWCFT